MEAGIFLSLYTESVVFFYCQWFSRILERIPLSTPWLYVENMSPRARHEYSLPKPLLFI